MRRRLATWGVAVVRGRSMQPTLYDGDRLLVRHGAVPRVGDLVVVRLPDGVVAVKRATAREPADRAPGWWVERDNPQAGVDSWLVGAIPDSRVLAVVVTRLWPLRRTPLRRRRPREEGRTVLAVYPRSFSPDDPLSGLEVGEHPDPEPQDGWTTVQVKAAALNHHDLWSLRGVGLAEDALPMILGCDAAGLDEDGNEVVVHAVVSDPSWTGDETLDPKRSLLSERYQGTFADRVVVPRRNVVPKPASLSFEEVACLPTAWLTAYRMLFVQGGLKPGDSVLVQGAGGGGATALIALARAGGLRVYATSRDETKRSRALELGAHEGFESNARLPRRVDAVMETVGKATWSHSVKALRPGGTIVISGTTSGPDVDNAELTRVFFLQLRVIGSTMGTRGELAALTELLDVSGVRPVIDRVLPLENATDGFAAMASGDLFGKVVFTR